MSAVEIYRGDPFQPSREDGRSDRRVLVELVESSEPGTRFSYEQLTEALSQGLDAEVDRARVYRAVRDANRTLLEERSRYLGVVRGQGYRMLSASEHLPTATKHKERAARQMQRGLEILSNTRLDELDPTQRALHEGQLLILSGLHQAVQASHKRHDKTESLLASLTKRVSDLEGTTD